MSRTLTDEDIETIAHRGACLIGECLMAKSAKPPMPIQKVEPEKTRPEPPVRLAYAMNELCAELGISLVSIYRLEVRGLLKANPTLRRKIYSRKEVERFLALDRSKW